MMNAYVDAGNVEDVEDVEIETFVPVVTPDDEQRIGRLAIASRLLREEVLVWMEENGSNRKEDAPMWRKAAEAWTRFRKATEDLLDLEPEHIDPNYKRKRRRRR